MVKFTYSDLLLVFSVELWSITFSFLLVKAIFVFHEANFFIPYSIERCLPPRLSSLGYYRWHQSWLYLQACSGPPVIISIPVHAFRTPSNQNRIANAKFWDGQHLWKSEQGQRGCDQSWWQAVFFPQSPNFPLSFDLLDGDQG